MHSEPDFSRFPRVQIWRRAAAFIIDLLLVWMVSAFLVSAPQRTLTFCVVFFILWLLLRVIFVSVNQGQSPGRWAFDMKTIDLRFGRSPGLLELFKRESPVAFGALLFVLGLGFFVGPAPERNSIGVVLLFPLVLDCGFALVDNALRQAFHDRLSRTAIVSTRRGFSLDLKLKRLFAQVSRRVRR